MVQAERFAQPVLVVSKCLEFAACRYDGQKIAEPLIQKLSAYVRFLPVCPEVEIGLGIPRDPVKVVVSRNIRTLVQPSTSLDVTVPMKTFAGKYLGALSEVDGFLLKSRSPSCGLKDVKVYPKADKCGATGRGAGFFGEAVLARFGHLAVEDEARLNDRELREHFFTKLFCLADFRAARKAGTLKRLIDFHARHKFLLMAYSQAKMRVMGRLVGDASGRTAAAAFESYGVLLAEALKKPAKTAETVNVLQHLFGFFSEDLTKREKDYFLRLLEKFHKGKTPLSVLLGILQAWLARTDKPYLEEQSFFRPFPPALMEF